MPYDSLTPISSTAIANALANEFDNFNSYDTINDFPQPGKVDTIYKDLSDGSTWVWDIDLVDYTPFIPTNVLPPIDSTPVENSANLVSSGGVWAHTKARSDYDKVQFGLHGVLSSGTEIDSVMEQTGLTTIYIHPFDYAINGNRAHFVGTSPFYAPPQDADEFFTTFYLDTNGNLQQVKNTTIMPEDLDDKILLGGIARALPSSPTPGLIQTLDNFPMHFSMKEMMIWQRYALGTIYSGSATLLSNSSDDNKLNQSSGAVFLFNGDMLLAPAIHNVNFSMIYFDGSFGYTSTMPDTVYDTLHYDDGSGTLATIPAGKYATFTVLRDAAKATGDGFSGLVFVYPKAYYDDAATALAAPVDSGPYPLEQGSAFTTHSQLVFLQGDVNITAINDLRPSVGNSTTISAASNSAFDIQFSDTIRGVSVNNVGNALLLLEPTFVQIYNDLSNYLTSSTAASTYLTQSSAASTYLTQASASSTYLTQANAASTYLTQSNAASTYLTQANAGSTYKTISSFNSDIAGYKTISSFNSDIANYLTSATATSTYKTIASFNSDIAAYKTISSFNSDIAAYLTSATAASTYLTQSDATSTYLTQSNAASTYLTQANASTTYKTVSSFNTDIANYLTTSLAASTYLTQVNAASTYLTQSNASSTYLTQANAGSTYKTIASFNSDIANYLTTSSASSTYLTQANAASTYLTITNAASTYPNETVTSIGALINGATAKTPPVDNDMLGLMDSAAGNVLKKLSWANVKAAMKTYTDTLYLALPAANGIAVRTGATSAVNRTITGTTGGISVNNGDGVSGNPTLDVALSTYSLYSAAGWTIASSTYVVFPTTAMRLVSGMTAGTYIVFGQAAARSNNNARDVFLGIHHGAAGSTTLATDGEFYCVPNSNANTGFMHSAMAKVTITGTDVIELKLKSELADSVTILDARIFAFRIGA